jgi:hypothetical protein
VGFLVISIVCDQWGVTVHGENEGFAGERVVIYLDFVRYSLSTTYQAILQLICTLLFLCCVRCYQFLPWYLAPLGYGLDVSRLDARILKKELVTCPPRGNLNRDPACTQSWQGIFSSAPIGSASWYFLSLDSRNQDRLQSGGACRLMVLDHTKLLHGPKPPQCLVAGPDNSIRMFLYQPGSKTAWVVKIIIMVVNLRIKPTEKQICGSNLFLITGLAHICVLPSYREENRTPNSVFTGKTYRDALYSRDWEEVLRQLWRGGRTKGGIFPSP